MRAVKPYIRSRKYELRKRRQIKIIILLIASIPPLIIFYNPVKYYVGDFIKELKTLKSPSLKSVPPPPPSKNVPEPPTSKPIFTVEIQSSPPEATVLVDKKLRGITPLSTVLEKGSHKIAILKEGYKDLRDSITIGKENEKFNFMLEKVQDLAPEPATPPKPPLVPEPQKKEITGFLVTIYSTPSGANIFIDKINYGVTPLWAFLKRGLYGIRIEKEGYKTKWDIIKVDKDDKKEFYFTLEKE